tara:strand:+ start:186 stop:1067 length:882 start_codon:yes stop_codon:yes gene_type:complete
MEKNSPKIPGFFKCELCNYKCSHKGDLKKHFNTQKHKMITLDNKNSPMDKSFICECGKTYKYASGLSKHKKKCNFKFTIEETIVKKDTELNADLVLKILEENKELRKMMKEEQEKHHKEISDLIPRVGNNNNNQFNLNFFLNEQCKDAINWDEFVKSIQLGVSDLEKIMDTDITRGITHILCKSINELGVYKRPIHCLDTKRKKLCIKNSDTWEQNPVKNKEFLEKNNRQLQQKHILMIQEWQKENPNWQEDENLKEVYVKIIQNVMGDVDEEKCLAEISKHTTIPKNEKIAV